MIYLIIIASALLAVPSALAGHWIGYRLAERYYGAKDRRHAVKMTAERERTLREFDEVTEQMWWNR